MGVAGVGQEAISGKKIGEMRMSEYVQALQNLVEDITPQLGGDLDLNGKNIDFPTTPNISDCLDEDNMASNSATMLATQQSIKAYADTKEPLIVAQTHIVDADGTLADITTKFNTLLVALETTGILNTS